MALIKADRVKETTTSTGTGTIALAGAATGYRAFSAVCAVGDTLYYAIAHQTVGEWEVGLATYSAANTLTRTTVHASSNSNLAVTFSAGTKDVFLSVTKAWLDTFITQTSGTTNYVAKTTGTGTIGDSQIFDNGTNVGIGVSPAVSKLDVGGTISSNSKEVATYVAAQSTLYIGGITSSNTAANVAFRAQSSGGSDTTYMYIAQGGNVGIGTTSPSDKLHVVGNVRAGNYTGGSGTYLALTGDLPGYSSGLYPTLKSDGNIYFAANGYYAGYIAQSSTGNHALAINGSGAVVKVGLDSAGTSYFAGGALAVGSTTAPAGQLYVTPQSAATKALVVRGASGQSANLQEWQNNSGTVLASIASDGGFSITNSTAYISRDSVYTDYVGQLVLQGATNNSKRLALGADTTNNIAFLQSYINSVGPAPLILNPNNVGTGSNTVGVGNVTSPDGQFHVTTHVSSRKVLVARAHASQSVNIQEWQNSSGNAYAAVNNQFGAQFHGWSGDGPHGGSEQVCLSAGLKSYWASGDAALMTIGFVDVAGVYDGTNWSMYFKTGSSGSRSERMRITHTGNVGIGTTSPSGKLHVRSSGSNTWPLYVQGSGGNLLGGFYQSGSDNCGLYLADSAGTYKAQIVAQASVVSYIATGANFGIGETSPSAQLHVTTPASATKALIVRGASGQSANLQEWQNNSGTALAYVNSSGQFSADGFGGNYLYAPTAYTDYWRVRSFYRAAPTTVGNYIEICSIQEGSGYYEIYAASEYGGGIGTTVKKYSLPTAFGTLGIGTLTPEDMVRQSGYETTFDFELEIHRVSAYDARLRLRRTAGTSARYVTITVQQHFLNATDITSLTGTGVSTYGGFNQIAYINPWNYSPPVPGGSGSGNGIAFYATSAISSGNGGDITVVPGVSAGGNQISNSDGCFVIGGMATGNLRHWCASRNLPATQGDYVEVCLLGDGNPAWFEVDLMAYQFAGTRCVRRYRFQDLYATSCVIEPYYETTTNSGNPSGIVELEYFYTGTAGQFALRLRRTAATGSAIPCYVNIRYAASFRQNIVGISGTGTSSVGSSLLGQSVVSPTTIQPRAPVGNSGSGLSLTIQGGNAAGTGNGGSILLQAGAYATSGSNGKVIVRGLASNTANLQEWQNNAGTALARVTSSGRFSNPNGFGQAEQFGNSATASSEYATAFGFNATGAGSLCTAVGWQVTANGTGGVAVGASTSTSNHYKPVAIGAGSSTGADRAIVIGGDSSAGGGYSIAIGSAVAANGTGSINIGFNSTVSANNVTSIGGTYTTDTYLYGTVTTTLGTATQKGFVVKAASGQSANLLELQNNSGTALTTIDSAGRIGVGTAPQAGYSLYGTGAIYAGGGGVLVAANAGLFYLNGRVGIGTGTATPVFGCEYTNYMRPIILSGYPDGAGYIGTIINTSSTYANATAKLLSVQNNGTEKFAVFSDGSMAGVDARLTGSIQITSNTPSAFTADQNDLALSASGFQRLSGTAARTITGIAPPSGASHVDGRMMRIYNVGSYNLTFKHNSTSSTAANRFYNVQAIDIIVGPNDYAELIYDGTNNGSGAAGWRVA